MVQTTIHPHEKMPWIPQSPRGIGVDSNELLYAQEQSYRTFYHNSEAIQTYYDSRSRGVTRKIQVFSNEPMLRTIIAINDEIDDLRAWETDSFGCPAPNYSTIRNAKSWITRLYFQVAFENWISPNITSGSEGEVVFEWWQGVKKLTAYVSSQTAEYIQVWGSDIYEEMSDGNAESVATCMKLWMWLRS